MGVLVRHWRASGICMIAYLDDWMFLLHPSEARHVLQRILADCRAARIAINMDKSQLEPVRRLEHLGFEVDLDHNRLAASTSRWSSLHEEIASALAEGYCHVPAGYSDNCLMVFINTTVEEAFGLSSNNPI